MDNVLYIVSLFTFLVVMLLVGFLASKKQKTAEDFYVGGRKFSTFTTTATQIASVFGGGLMIAHVGLGYQYGFAEFIYVGVAVSLGLVLLAVLVAKWLREQNFFTTADWMCHTYGESKSLRSITSIVSILVSLGWWVSQPIAAGKIINVLTGIPLNWGIVIAAAIVVIYTMSGGIIAVAYTDVAQFVLMFIGIFIIFPFAIIQAGGFGEIFNSVPPENLTFTAPGEKVVWGWVLAVLPGHLVIQVLHQRIYSAKSTSAARRGLLYSAMACVIAGVWASLLGMALYTINPNIADGEMVIPWALTNLLPTAIGAIMLGAIVAAVISTADSAIHSATTSITRDFYQVIINPGATDKEILTFTKYTISVLGVLGVVIGIYMPSVLGVLVLGYTLTTSGLLFPLFLGHYWSRMTKEGAIAGMIAGVSTALIQSLSTTIADIFMIPAIGTGLAASFIAMVTVSFLTKPRTTLTNEKPNEEMQV